METNLKRLFFAFEVQAPWPKPIPAGRRLDEAHRHMTVAFLGEADYDRLQAALPKFPVPPFKVGLAGFFRPMSLSSRAPPARRGLACRLARGERSLLSRTTSKQLIAWLQGLGI